MKSQIIKAFSLIAGMLAMATACKKDEDIKPVTPPVTNQQELITTVKLTFTDSANTSSVSTFTFNDPDGDGGAAPTIDTIILAPNKTYLVSVLLLDATKTPVDTISNEVLEEANDHMLFYNHAGVGITTSYLDQDTNNPPLPIGLSTKWKTNATTASGTSQVILKHQPGVKNGTMTPGDTDVDVVFPSRIQ